VTAACDTSVLVPALSAQHPDHDAARVAMAPVRAIPGHVLLETYSVLTRLPPLLRVSTADAAAALAALTHDVIELPSRQRGDLLVDIARHGISGGAVYDALVGVTAAHHGLTLVTRDRRARSTYEALGVRYALV
jgi:predicted nucleic acid-binding protein